MVTLEMIRSTRDPIKHSCFVAFIILSMCVNSGLAAAEPAPRNYISSLEPPTRRVSGVTRIAFVVGNSDYHGGWTKLKDAPLADARKMSITLKSLGFFVVVGLNLDRATLLKATDIFEKHLIEARVFGGDGRKVEKPVALFYYSGHGWSFDSSFEYIVPVDALPQKDGIGDPKSSISINRVAVRLDDNSSKSIVILDSCRTFSGLREADARLEWDQVLLSEGRSRLVAYGTAPGATSDIPPDGKHSVFSDKLMEYLSVPGLEIRMMLGQVGELVDEASNQRPAFTSNIKGDFYFKPSRMNPP